MTQLQTHGIRLVKDPDLERRRLFLVGSPSRSAARLDIIARRADALADLLAELGRPAHAAVAGNLAQSIRSVARELVR